MTIQDLITQLQSKEMADQARASPRLKDLRKLLRELCTIGVIDPTMPIYAHGRPIYSPMAIPWPSTLHHRYIGEVLVWNFECSPDGHRPIDLEAVHEAVKSGLSNENLGILEI